MLIINIKRFIAMQRTADVIGNLAQTDQIIGFVNINPVFLGKTGVV